MVQQPVIASGIIECLGVLVSSCSKYTNEKCILLTNGAPLSITCSTDIAQYQATPF